MPPKPGDRVTVVASEIREGILMPNQETDAVIIKLDNGYNIGIARETVKEIRLVASSPASKEKKFPPQKQDTKKKTIAILHTGGTIASKVDYATGGVIASFSDSDFISMFPEVHEIANIRSRLVSNMMSEDMRFSHYQLMCKAIEEAITDKADGIIIGHGTDTLALTAAALAFMVENPPIPIILVGSQRSTDRGSTDGAQNLICAAAFIAKTDFKGVAICMHESTSDSSCLILPPCKTKKLHTSRRDAFRPVNDIAIARVDYETKNIMFLKQVSASPGKLSIRPKMEEKIAILKAYPNMGPILIDALTEGKYKGIILEGTGLGHAPTNIKENEPNYKALERFINEGGVVAMTSNCVFGRVHPDVYVNLRRLKKIGALFSEDMLTETAFVKLSWLLSNFKKDEVPRLFTTNLRGEINERLGQDDFLP